jgi:hypothetical protein
MATGILNELQSINKIQKWSEQTRIVAENGLNEEEFSALIKSVYE